MAWSSSEPSFSESFASISAIWLEKACRSSSPIEVATSAGLLPLFAIRFINAERYKRLSSILSPTEIAQVSAVTLFTWALLIAAIATGHVADWLMLWFLPTRLGVLILNIFFQWLPHHPFDRTERYLNTRISLWSGGGVVLNLRKDYAISTNQPQDNGSNRAQ